MIVSNILVYFKNLKTLDDYSHSFKHFFGEENVGLESDNDSNPNSSPKIRRVYSNFKPFI